MATLADELANDFLDDDSDIDNGEEDHNPEAVGFTMSAPTVHSAAVDQLMKDQDEEDEDMEDPDALHDEAAEETEDRLERERKEQAPKDMRSVSSFMKSLEPILEVSLTIYLYHLLRFTSSNIDLTYDCFEQKISHYRSLPPEQQTKNDAGLVEDNPEYQLLTKSNTFSTYIDDHKLEVLKFIRDHYSTRFPELETLLADPMEYTYAVAIIGNGPMDNNSLKELTSSTNNIVGPALNTLISRPKLMTVTVEAQTSKGQPLPDTELTSILSACSTMLSLERARASLTEFVESRMNLFAPNLTRLLGSRTAAAILNARGGLTNLANTRASNIAAIGSKRVITGLATNIGVRSQGQGHLYDSDLVRSVRPELRTQAMRIISSKAVLAARVDRVHESPDGTVGDDLLEQTQKRLDKLTEPPPNRGQKALPAPDDKPSKKRGGRRARKAKEATAMTEIRKAQNRMAFGKEEQEVGYGTGEGTVGMGMIGQSNEGRIRALQIDNRTRAKLSKKNAGWGGATPAPGGGSGLASSLRGFGQGAGAGNATVLKGHGLRTSGVGGLATSLGAGAGTASSLNFGVKSGLELVDPKIRAAMERKNQAEKDSWFKGGTFTQVGGGAASVKAAAAPGGGGFKVPGLPVKK